MVGPAVAPPPPAAAAAAAAYASSSGRPKPRKSKMASLASGALSGGLVSACVQPLDVIRTRMQADMVQGVMRGTMPTMWTIVGEVRAATG